MNLSNVPFPGLEVQGILTAFVVFFFSLSTLLGGCLGQYCQRPSGLPPL